MRRPKTFLLDNNARNYLFGREGFSDDQLAEVRRRLLCAAKSHAIRVPLTTVAVNEMAGAHWQPFYRSMVDFAFEASLWRRLMEPQRRAYNEIVLRRELLEHEVCFEGDQVREIHGLLLDPVRAAAIAADAKLAAKEEQARDVELKAEAIRRIKGEAKGTDWKTDFRRRLATEREEVIAEWGRHQVRCIAATAGDESLDIDERLLPHPRLLPTVWFAVSRLLAHVERLVVNDGSATSKKQPNLFDYLMIDDAAYADVLITQDQKLLNCVRNSGLKLEAIYFDDWARASLT